MSEPYLGQITPTALNFAPRGYAMCNGQLLPIAQNQALFALIGVTYGGNGVSTFQLPDLRGRTPIGIGQSTSGSNYTLGQSGGTEGVTLQAGQIPAHTHATNYSSANAVARNPTQGLFGTTSGNLYAPSNGTQVPLNARTVTTPNADQPHPNLQPYLVLNFCIALSGIFPSRS
ncbi:Microcystin-dependent protein [Dyella jiangningensis]|uniref:phage tail protein n=1 Tax=Dyella sp. AtDHG13 TaxID=1938897 RepID=UPI00088C64F1|nr:tail fiber protein [Dyella sp. AtDHG13]PXV59882.1 microcystin-dependent protein [Dyella sp. AtDHG13]SDJ19044.1 Microcystin-dependent protein [Dyella jiangningensis]